MLKRFYPELNDLERRTFRLHFVYASLDGFIMGLFILNEFVFLKSLRGSSYQVGMLFQFSVVVLIFLLFFNEFLRRAGNKRKMLRWTAVITRMPLFFMILFPAEAEGVAGRHHWIFLLLFLVYYMANPVLFPTINLILKRNYRHQHFGALYSFSTSSSRLLMLLATFGFGLVLDQDPFAFRVVYPIAGALSMFSIFMLAAIPFNAVPAQRKRKGLLYAVGDSLRTQWNILKRNKPYRDYEISFILYGFAYMSTFAVITIFYERELHLSYSGVAFYKNVFNILAIVFIPVFGRLIGKTDPRRFAVWSFLMMALYIFFTGLTEYLPWKADILGIQWYLFLFLSVIFNGLFIAMNTLLWHIGSAYFSRAEEAGDYQAVHASLTGMRALFAPLAGVWFYETIGFTWTFAIAILSLVAAMVVNHMSVKKSRLLQVFTVSENIHDPE
ncbi:MAG TPA: MFS transporter [Bacteroidetes bacterium]|nr:MFS transporter [Bacteroidota bacterium]